MYVACEWIRPPGHYLISFAKIVQNNGKYFCTSHPCERNVSTHTRFDSMWMLLLLPPLSLSLLLLLSFLFWCLFVALRAFFVYPCVNVVVVRRLFYGFSHSFNFSLAQTHSHSLIYLPTLSSSRILTANKPKNRSLSLGCCARAVLMYYKIVFIHLIVHCSNKNQPPAVWHKRVWARVRTSIWECSAVDCTMWARSDWKRVR